MNEQASVVIPKELLQPVIDAHVSAAIAKALSGPEAIVKGIVERLCNQNVDSEGRPSSYHNDRKTWLQWAVENMLKQAVQATIAKELEAHKERLKEYLTDELSKKKSPLVKSLVEGMVSGMVTNGLNYRLEVTSKG